MFVVTCTKEKYKVITTSPLLPFGFVIDCLLHFHGCSCRDGENCWLKKKNKQIVRRRRPMVDYGFHNYYW